MDNVCHTLVGAAMGEAGLKRRTGLATATLLIGANLPDVDVAVIPFASSLEWRRGWTHGVLALAVLPWVLTGLVLAWDRWVRRRGGRVPENPVRPRQVLLLSYLAVLSHPVLDWLNTYGMRWLMPFSDRWFYGDALFIVDPWVWGALAVGVAAARRSGAARGARVALGAFALYALVMHGGSLYGRRMVAAELASRELPPAEEIMVGPVPINPLVREVVVDAGDRYRFGTIRWLPRPRLELAAYELAKNLGHPAARLAAATPEGRSFLTWSRFPFVAVEGDGTRVRLDDARYTVGHAPSWAAVIVDLRLGVEGTPVRPLSSRPSAGSGR